MSKSGDKSLQAQEAEAQAEAGANPYSFTAPPDSPRAVLQDGTLAARVGVEDLIGEAQALVDGLVRLREDMDRFSGRHVPDPLVLREPQLREAEAKGANAVLCLRFTTNSMMEGAAELLAYGTGVVVEDE